MEKEEETKENKNIVGEVIEEKQSIHMQNR